MRDDYAVELKEGDIKEGELVKVSNIRPNKIFTADKNIILYKAAKIKPAMQKKIIERIIKILNGN